MLLRDKGLQSSLQKIVTFMFQALVLVHNVVTSVWHIYLCCTALCCLLLCFYSIVTHSKAGNCHFDVSGFYKEENICTFYRFLITWFRGLCSDALLALYDVPLAPLHQGRLLVPGRNGQWFYLLSQFFCPSSKIAQPKYAKERARPFLVESSPISFFADCILSYTFT